MTLCNKSYSATQFALLSALAAVGGVYVGPLADWFIELHGWAWFYLFSVAISFPGLGLLMLCRTTLTATQRTGDFLRRGHFSAGYRLALLLAKAVGMGTAAAADEFMLGNKCHSALSEYTHGMRSRLSRDETIPTAASWLSLTMPRAGATKNNVRRRQRPAFWLITLLSKDHFLFMSQE